MPSPPSAIGSRSAAAPASSTPPATASATSAAEKVPLKLSGATSTGLWGSPATRRMQSA